MKKTFITVALILAGLTTFSQENNRKWFPSIKVGVGTWLDVSYLLHTEIGAQVEYRSTETFSLVANADFARNFALNSTATEFNQLSIYAGPRFNIQQYLFVGAGGGYVRNFYKTNTSFSSGALLLQSYAGFNTRKFQYSVDFKANVANGEVDSYISLCMAFKIGKQE
jgi:hypothetical protein